MESSDVKIYIEYSDEDVPYPDAENLFAPSERYPEYEYAEISDKKNYIYEMVRNAFHGMKFDNENFGLPSWNPLSDIISPGDKVVLKPNLVKSCNNKAQYECTLTHPSVIKAVLDYLIKANPQSIILGDAPIQGADMGAISEALKLNQLVQYYKERSSVDIQFIDFRDLIVKTVKHINVVSKEKNPNSEEYVTVQLGKNSKHYEDSFNGKYGVVDYDEEQINNYHNGARHDYTISKYILEADVIVNMPKPKTHRYAGLTAAQKNFVGACSDKETLPHFKAGSKCVGGDETNDDGIISKLIRKFYRIYQRKAKQKKINVARFYFYIYAILLHLQGKKFFLHGAWYGNDTIWRTIIDLNKIILYTNKNGIYCEDSIKRKVFTIGDMIICGEKEGPLCPSPKKMNMIMMSNNMAVFDYTFCRMMGFNEELIPTVHHSIRNTKISCNRWEDVRLHSNCEKLNNAKISMFERAKDWDFIPHSYWIGVL